MAYTKQNFENGQILTAEQLNHMEQGIAAPDWNDVTNKPFYDLEPWIPPVTLPEPGEESMIIRDHMISASAADKVCWIKENTKYIVNLNGTDYECESFTYPSNPQFKGNVYLGNASILLPGENNGMPFLLISNTNLSPAGTDVILEDRSLISCTISIRLADEPIVKHLDPKYIKDMYYETEPIETVLVDNLASTTDEEEWPPCNFVVGDAYRVIWNGVEYRCVCYDDNGWNVIGGTDDYPFYIDDDGGDCLYISPEDGSDEWVISIIHSPTEIHYLDPKYIKDMYYETEPVEKLLVEKATVVCTDGAAQNPFSLELIAGETYRVTWSDVTCECVAYIVEEHDALCLGNGGAVGVSGGNGEPFLIKVSDGTVSVFAVSRGEYTVSIALITEKSVMHHIGAKYLPIFEETPVTVFSHDAVVSGGAYNLYARKLVGEYVVIFDGLKIKTHFSDEDEIHSFAPLPFGALVSEVRGETGVLRVELFENTDAFDGKHSLVIVSAGGVINKAHLPQPIQPDWNQNDDTAFDFVKNRPFYTVSEKTYMGSIEFTATSENKLECTYSNSDSTFDYLNRLVSLGEIVEVEIFTPIFADPVAVGMVALTQDRAYLQFNGALSGSVNRSDGNVLTVTVNVPGVTLPSGMNYTIKFYDTTAPIYKPIEEKYLPEGVPYAGSKILYEFNYDGNSDGKITTIALGQRAVKISGLAPNRGEFVGATMVCQESELGEVSYTSLSVQGIGSEGGGFMLIAQANLIAFVISKPGTYSQGTFPEAGIYVSDSGEEYVKALYKAGDVIQPVDPRCIVLTSPNGTKFNLTVSNDGTLSATPVS